MKFFCYEGVQKDCFLFTFYISSSFKLYPVPMKIEYAGKAKVIRSHRRGHKTKMFVLKVGVYYFGNFK